MSACVMAALAPVTAQAQAYQCRMPQTLSVPQVRPDGPTRKGPVTGYTLALSWSPEFCKGREEQASQRLQCSGRNGRFGFVAHGLWPEGHGAWPQWCPTPRRVAPGEVRRNLCMMPSERLIAEEWAKHGSCMLRHPESYFKVTRILYGSLRFPDLDRLSRDKGLTAGILRERFVAANKGWRADAVGISLNARGWLEELRLCYGRDFLPAKCDARFGAKDSTAMKVWRGF